MKGYCLNCDNYLEMVGSGDLCEDCYDEIYGEALEDAPDSEV